MGPFPFRIGGLVSVGIEKPCLPSIASSRSQMLVLVSVRSVLYLRSAHCSAALLLLCIIGLPDLYGTVFEDTYCHLLILKVWRYSSFFFVLQLHLRRSSLFCGVYHNRRGIFHCIILMCWFCRGLFIYTQGEYIYKYSACLYIN